MHDSVMHFFNDHLTIDEVYGKRVLEVGSLNVNGSVRPLVESYEPRKYIGTDIREGRGVDMVLPGEQVVEAFGIRKFDVVICTEVLEHAQKWWEVASNIKQVLAPNGVLMLTTRSPGFPQHDHPGDFWRFTIKDIGDIFGDLLFNVLQPDPQQRHPGVFLKAWKPEPFEMYPEKMCAVYSMALGRRM